MLMIFMKAVANVNLKRRVCRPPARNAVKTTGHCLVISILKHPDGRFSVLDPPELCICIVFLMLIYVKLK